MSEKLKMAQEWIDRRLPFTAFIEKHVTQYPTPRNLNYWWNFGSALGIFFTIQIVTGFWLTMYYKPDANLAFASVEHIMRDVNFGWLLRYLHAICPSALFLFMYIHIGRGMFYGSYKEPRELIWWMGLALFLAFMAESFMGYLLPWGQMSFWGATAITNLFDAIPIVGPDLVVFMRGDFAIGDATLNRFFSIHTTVLPIAIIGGLIVMKLAALHHVGSNNPVGIDIDKKKDAIPFAPYYVTKDLWFGSLLLMIFCYLVFFDPEFVLEPDNNEPANPFKTPLHIVPEWYFLPFYAILRAIPHKLAGVVAMNGAILIVALLPLLDWSPVRSARYQPVRKWMTYLFFVNFVVLSWLGLQPPVGGLLLLGQACTAFYFLYFVFYPLFTWIDRTKTPPERI